MADAAFRSGRSDLTETVYSHLRAIAQQQMNNERAGHTLSATALVHEAFLRLGGTPAAPGEARGAPLLFAAAEAMRRILIEHARARGRVKRGGRAARVSLDAIADVADLDGAAGEASESVFAFDEAFRRLEELFGLHGVPPVPCGLRSLRLKRRDATHKGRRWSGGPRGAGRRAPKEHRT